MFFFLEQVVVGCPWSNWKQLQETTTWYIRIAPAKKMTFHHMCTNVKAPKLSWLLHPTHLSSEHYSFLLIHHPTSWLCKNSCRSSLQQLWVVISTPEKQTCLFSCHGLKLENILPWCLMLRSRSRPASSQIWASICSQRELHVHLLLWEGEESLA